jgi:hypothetical protein
LAGGGTFVEKLYPPLAKAMARERVRATRSSIMMPWMMKRVFIVFETALAPEGSNWSRVLVAM